ncbi:hypothetical protein QE345_gp120 [Pseudomonas phage vB_PA45_GUMS]|uniref:Uncharacterized protein n=1 Tax=Pseudomonas phage vB_PA45_GUMS TaxID=2656517 RepID=A0A8T8BG80_9CAUD|nr:hypothetical protein QE345_gp120 [Pseudomonas phage vB_PA45_GUMS]QGK90269.1 hypothetical protein [Pseudomonas phage vB_PA45_GUMS]
MNILFIHKDSAYTVQSIREFLQAAVDNIRASGLIVNEYSGDGLGPNAPDYRVAIVTPEGFYRTFYIQVELATLYRINPRLVFTDADSPGYKMRAETAMKCEEWSYMDVWQHIRLKDMTAMASLSDWSTHLASPSLLIDVDPQQFAIGVIRTRQSTNP